jgi:hypothetical protein
MDVKEAEETKPPQPPQASAQPQGKKQPMKLPPRDAKPTTGTSKDAASETLRKFFGGR